MAQQFFIVPKDYASLKHTVVVITGASSGIGLATVKLLLDTGAYVVAGDVNPCPLQHENLAFCTTNVTVWTDLLALFALARERFGRVDHIFANAGISARADYLPHTLPDTATLEEPSRLTYDINLQGCINTAYIGLHHLRTQHTSGTITLTASASAFQEFGVTDYCAAKHGVLGFMRGLLPNLPALLPLKIRVNCIGPDWTLTGLVPKELCDAAGLETQGPEVVARQVALLMADVGRQGEFIYSIAGRNYEIEKSVLKTAARTVVGKGNELEDGWERLKLASGGMRTGDLKDAEGINAAATPPPAAAAAAAITGET